MISVYPSSVYHLSVYHLLICVLCLCQVYSKTEPKPVTFLPSQNSRTVHVGQTAKLECRFSHLEGKRVIWRNLTDPNRVALTVGTETFLNTNRIYVDHSPGGSTWDLVIRQARVSDAGMYQCQVSARAKHGKMEHHVMLVVKEAPLTTPVARPDIKIIGSTYVERGGQIYLICNATGLEHPPDDLDWFLNGDKLMTRQHQNNRVLIRKVVSITSRTIMGILEIQNAKMNDSGTYVCRTSNLQIDSIIVNVLNDLIMKNVDRKVKVPQRGIFSLNGVVFEKPSWKEQCAERKPGHSDQRGKQRKSDKGK